MSKKEFFVSLYTKSKAIKKKTSRKKKKKMVKMSSMNKSKKLSWKGI